MKNYGLSDIHWVDEKLYFRGKDVGLRIVPFMLSDVLFRIQWPDGSESVDFYNFTRARLAAKTYILDEFLNRGGEAAGGVAGAFK